MKLTQLHLYMPTLYRIRIPTHLPAIPHAPDLEMIRAVSALSLTRPPEEERPLCKDNLILSVTAQQKEPSVGPKRVIREVNCSCGGQNYGAGHQPVSPLANTTR